MVMLEEVCQDWLSKYRHIYRCSDTSTHKIIFIVVHYTSKNVFLNDLIPITEITHYFEKLQND
jgi:hypothetical protein